MGTGASSNKHRSAGNTAVTAARWRAKARSEPLDLAPTTSGDTKNANINKPDNRQGKGNAKGVGPVVSKLKEREKPIEQKKGTTFTAKLGSPPGNKNKSTGKQAVKGSKKPLAAGTSKGGGKQRKVSQTATGSDLCQRVERVLRGAIDVNCPVNSKIIRIFLSSTFTDTEHERNALMEHVYPKLRRFCQKKGYEFQVVDMRWGVRDEATNTHMTTKLCLREIRACQDISVGPNFVTLLSEKYGYRPLLPSIDCQEFEKLLDASSDSSGKDLLSKWYKKDENLIPASYILQPVSTWIPNYFNENNPGLEQEAKDQWYKEFNTMRTFLQHTAKDVFKEKSMWHKYVRSVCEVEIECGLLQAENPKRSCLWFHRQINGLDPDEHEECPEIPRFVDCHHGIDSTADDHPQALLQNLKDSKMMEVVPVDNTCTYQISWTPKGIDPSVDKHKDYLNQFCTDFENKITSQIDDSIAEYKTAEINNFLYVEVVQHTLFCKKKLEVVYGRKKTLTLIEDYIKGPSRQPLVIHGKSGCGKTSVSAMAAKTISDVLEQKACIILRFLGTTPRSSTIRRLLKSIMQQIKNVYKLNTKIPHSAKDVAEQFPKMLSSATKEQPLVVILDALDQLSPLGGARRLAWLPRQLPPHVKFIVSTLPDQQYKCFPMLKALFKDPKCFVEVPLLTSTDVSDILTKWLDMENRTLQEHQLQVLTDAFQQCPLPLFLKISYDEARLWRSYSSPSETRLETTIREAINSLFGRVEMNHGELLVRRALGYLTAASHGLTTNELEDILSCDEELLEDVFQYWTPPIRRLPPLLWVRIRADLGSYLVDRGADGAQVTCWYHRQFVEAAQDRYLSDQYQKQKIHSAIADYFLGKNFVEEGTNETTFIHGKQVRLASISRQPLLLSEGKYNLRKLHELPRQLIWSQKWQELKSEVLCNFHWLVTKIKARSLRSVMDNFHTALSVTSDPDIVAVGETLQLAQDAILSDPKQLAAQFVGRLYECKVQDAFHVIRTNLSPALTQLVLDAHSPPEPTLLPSRGFLTPPGGQLVETLVGHSTGVYGLTATSNGKYAVTGSQNGVVKVWDISDGSLLMTVPEVGEEIGAVTCCRDDEIIVASSKTGIAVISFETGEILHSLKTKYFDSSPPFVLAGDRGNKIVFFTEKSLEVVATYIGKTLHSFGKIKPVGDAGQNGLVSAWNDTVLCNSKEDENSLKVIGINGFKIRHSITVFDEKDEEEYLHLTRINMKSENEVLVAKKMKIDLYSVDSGEKLRSYKCKIDDWIQHLSLAPTQNILVFPKREKVALLDLQTGERRDVLEHPNYISRTFSVDCDVILTSGGDNVVRVWDLTREDVLRHVQKPESLMNIYSIPGDSRHLVTVGRLGIDNFCVTVWDLSTALPVRKVTGISSNYLQIISERKAAIRVGDRVAIVNMDTFKVLTVLKGKLPPFNYAGTLDIWVVNERTEILTNSYDRKSLAIYDVETGDRVAELKSSRPQHDIRNFMVNTEGTVVVFNDEPCDNAFVWDLVARKQLFTIRREGYERLTLSHTGLTPDGKYVVTSERKTQKDDYIRHPEVWDVLKKKFAHDLRYENDTNTVSLTVMDNARVVTTHEDMSLVCWDIARGTPLHLLSARQHFGNRRIDVMASDGDLVVSYEEKTLILWDMKKGVMKATFSADKVTAVHPMGEGQCIALGCESVLPLVLLTLHGGDLEPYKFPTEGTNAMAGTDVQIVFEGIEGKFVEEEEQTRVDKTDEESEEKLEKEQDAGT